MLRVSPQTPVDDIEPHPETGFPTILSNWLREIVLSLPEAARTIVVKLIIGALLAGGGHVMQAFLALTQRLGARNRGCGSASDRVRFWRTSRGHGFWQRRIPQRPVRAWRGCCNFRREPIGSLSSRGYLQCDIIPMPESSDLSLMTDRVDWERLVFHALPRVRTYWLWYHSAKASP